MRRKARPVPTPKLSSDAAERIGTIVAAAERAAETVIDDAEAEAARYLAEEQAAADRIVSDRLSSLAELSETISAQAEEIRLHCERLLASLEVAKAELGAGRDSGLAEALAPVEPVAAERGSHLSAVAPVEEHGWEPGPPAEPEPPAARPTPAGARLLATQMAVSGNSREEIASRLRNGFEIEDTAAILDAILGPEG
jgi:hypothetical protein